MSYAVFTIQRIKLTAHKAISGKFFELLSLKVVCQEVKCWWTVWFILKDDEEWRYFLEQRVMQMGNGYDNSDYESCKLKTAATMIVTSNKVFIFNH